MPIWAQGLYTRDMGLYRYTAYMATLHIPVYTAYIGYVHIWVCAYTVYRPCTGDIRVCACTVYIPILGPRLDTRYLAYISL